MGETTRPLFLLSLPRSGSTLLQRMLGAHPDVATVSEPWLLLPLLYSLRPGGVASEYEHSAAARAIEDLAEQLPGGRAEYEGRIRELALAVYTSAAGGRRYFLDKTPRYHFVVDELFELFPDAAFVFLWRSPLGVISSMIEGAGHWNLDQWEIDLHRGLTALTDAYRQHRDTVAAVRYEDLLADPEGELARILAYLGLPDDPGLAAGFTAVKLEGRFGDRRGPAEYGALSREPLEKWRRTLAPALRKRWVRGYLRDVGKERLALQGYDLAGLEADLDSLPSQLGTVGSDAAWMAYARYRRSRQPRPSWRVT